MSWGDIFFGFRGRINRKIYWTGSVAAGVAGLIFASLLSYLATGNPLAPEVWERPADEVGIWGPVWLAYFGFLVWPMTALAVKRLHDRARSGAIWYVYYGLALAASLLPLRASLSSDPDAPFSIFGIAPGVLAILAPALMTATTILAGYIFIELGVLRGVRGPNAHGADPLPADYHGGDYDTASLLFALEGRISRLKWWLGIFIVMSVSFGLLLAIGAILGSFLDRHPEFMPYLKNPELLNTKEAQPLVDALGLWMIGPVLMFGVVMWSLFALGVKRLHDRGLSSWLILVVVLPFLGVVVSPSLAAAFELGEQTIRVSGLLVLASIIWGILQFGILKGETGPNENGPDPLAG